MKKSLLAGAALLGLAAALPAAAQTAGNPAAAGGSHDVLGTQRGQGNSQTGSSEVGSRTGDAAGTGAATTDGTAVGTTGGAASGTYEPRTPDAANRGDAAPAITRTENPGNPAATSNSAARDPVLGVQRGQGSSTTGSSELGQQSPADRDQTGTIGREAPVGPGTGSAPAGTPTPQASGGAAAPGPATAANEPTTGDATTRSDGGIDAERTRNPGNPIATSNSAERHEVLGTQRGQGNSQTGSSELAARDGYRSAGREWTGRTGSGTTAEDLMGAGVVDSQGREVGEIADVVASDTGEVGHVIVATDRYGADEPTAYLVVVVDNLQPAQGGDGGYVLGWDDAAMDGATRYELQDGMWVPR